MLSNSKFLLPYRYQIIGWWLLIASAVGCLTVATLGSFSMLSFSLNKALQVVSWTMFYISLLLLSISREKHEDEYITALRGRIVCIVVACALILKTIIYVASVVCVFYHGIGLLGKISFLSIPTNFIVLDVAYIVIFKISLYIANRRLKNYAE